MMPRRLLPPLLALTLLAGCQSLSLSPAAEQALRMHNQASGALQRGELDKAASGFREAMRQSAALDDWRGEGLSRLGLAVTTQRQGRAGEAEQVLHPLLADERLPYSREQRRQALLRRAQWRLAAGDWDGLRDDLAQAGRWCDNCHDSTLHRLRAQLALRQGELGTAWEEAASALSQAGDDEEKAEALRLRANIAIAESATGRHGNEGRAAAEAALDMDRRLGNSVGIFQDLLLRAWLAHLAGDQDTASWLHRACEVGLASGQNALLRQLRQLPEEIWHVTTSATHPSNAGTAGPAAGPGDCRQP